MADPKKAGKISGMNPLAVLTGDELMEVSSRQLDGTWKTFSILVNKIRTNAGLSAYEVALVNGFEGTQEEWLESLKGQSAYQTAVDLGFVGTEAAFIKSLVGPSAYKVAVEDGFLGDETMWLESLRGKSAYQIALVNGFVGTQSEWLASLKGKSAYQIALELDPGIGTQAEWIASLHGESAYQTAVDLGYVGTEEEWIASLHGKSAYEIWVSLGNSGTEAEFIESLKGNDGHEGTDGTDGLSAYDSAIIGGYTGTEQEFYEQLAKLKSGGGGGSVFITDITPQNLADNVGTKVFNPNDITLVSCTATTSAVIVKVLAITGYSRFRPLVTVNGSNVPMLDGSGPTLFEGTVMINVPAGGRILAEHNDGATWITTVKTDDPPIIQTARFTSAYPGAQTELKAGDKMSVTFTADSPVVGYEIDNFGAFVASSGSFATGTTANISNLTIADRGNTTTTVGFKIRVKKQSGAWSDWFLSTVAGNVDLTNTVKLNNIKPTITFSTVAYPAGQKALKGTEAATVNHTVTNYDAVTYTSTELTVSAPTVFEAAKVVNRLSGNYNIATNNLTVTATRAANGTSTTGSTVVAIANTAPTFSISVPQVRLQSGGENDTVVQPHIITITSTQALEDAPTMTAPAATWAGTAFLPNAARTTWTRTLMVSDADVKGTYSWGNPTVKSMSGQVVTSPTSGATYVLGGFVKRRFKVAGWPNREGSIGTHVADTAKLVCQNLSKGAVGSPNAISLYEPAMTTQVGHFTITGPSKVLNPKGDLWYNNDQPNATSNTAGSMTIELEELP